MKTLSIILILSLLHLSLACYSTALIKENEGDSQNKIRERLEDSSNDIVVKTYDSHAYQFNQDTYILAGDTLQGKGCKIVPDSNFCKIENQKSGYKYISDEKMSPEVIKIALRNIKEIESEEFDTLRTIQGVLVSTVAISFLFLAIAESSMKGGPF